MVIIGIKCLPLSVLVFFNVLCINHLDLKFKFGSTQTDVSVCESW